MKFYKIYNLMKVVLGLLFICTLFDVIKSDYGRRFNRHTINSNQEYNKVMDIYDLKTEIEQQMSKGVAKFFDLNDFDGK